MFKNTVTRARALGLGLVVMASVPAFAAGTGTLADITGAVSFTDVATAVMAISVSLAGVYIAIKGAKILIRMIKGG